MKRRLTVITILALLPLIAAGILYPLGHPAQPYLCCCCNELQFSISN